MKIRQCFTAESGITHAQDFEWRAQGRTWVFGLCGYSEEREHIASVPMPERSIECARCWQLATENRNPKPANHYTPHPSVGKVHGEWRL